MIKGFDSITFNSLFTLTKGKKLIKSKLDSPNCNKLFIFTNNFNSPNITTMPFISVYLHCIWSTKYRIPFLHSYNVRKQVWNHIKDNAASKGIFIDHVNGHKDHCHCLISLCSNQEIEFVVKLIKGECSHWINDKKIIGAGPEEYQGYDFDWQDEYYAVSISRSALPTVRNYIKFQERHHKKQSFKDEIEFLENYHGFVKHR